jgi:N4-gp56 family major capsid protein
MSTTTQSTTSNLAIKVWSRKAFSDSVKATLYGQLQGTTDRSIVQVKPDLKKDKGDRITFGLRALPQGIGVQDSETLEGREEALGFTDFSINLGEKRHAFSVEMNLSAQRTMFDVKAEANAALGEWLEDYIDTTFFEYLTGVGLAVDNNGAPTGLSKYHPRGALGGNALLAPSNDRIVYGGVGNTSRATLVASDVMTLSVLDKLAERAKLASPTMRKAQFNGKSCWVVILHPYQVNDIRSNTGTLQWGDIVKAGMMGGGADSFAGEVLGMYRDMLLIESVRIPTFGDGTAGNVRGARALFLGAQAAVVAHGNGTDNNGKLKLVEKMFDYDKYYGVAATLIWGIQRARFTNQSDFGCFMVDTAAAPHN